MPAINNATDQGQRARFARLHGLSVLVILAHIAAAAAVSILFAGTGVIQVPQKCVDFN